MSESAPMAEDPTAAEEVEDLLETLLEAFDVEGEVVVGVGDDTVSGRVTGDDVGALIGRRGHTLEAIQHIAQRTVLREGRGPRVVIDIAGYREQRELELRRLADDAASEAIATGQPVRLEPMSASDRRVVHECLRDRGGVETHSVGDEPERRLVVTLPTG